MRANQFVSTVSMVLLSACAVDPDTLPGGGGDDGETEQEEEQDDPPPPPPPAPLATDGTYQLESELDIQAAALLPQTAYDAVETIRGLRDMPGQTLFDLAEAAGVPAVGTLRDALPWALESRLYGWIDSQLASYTHGDGPIATAIDLVLTLAETSIAELRLQSELTLDGGAATHRLDTIVFAFEGHEVSQELAGFSTVLDLEETPAATCSPDGTEARVTLGAHSFGIPYGELALAALDDVLVAEFGTDLRGTLGLLVDCPSLAADVADRCYLGVCVGHESELLAICEGALDYVADEIRERVGAVRFDAISLDAGTARMIDGAPADRVADQLTGGVWTARIDAGMGPRSAPGTFTGTR
jgi:hypothetical protein